MGSLNYVPMAAFFNDPVHCIIAAEFENAGGRTVGDVEEFIREYPTIESMFSNMDRVKYFDVLNLLKIFLGYNKGFLLDSRYVCQFTFECFVLFGLKRLIYPNDLKLKMYVNNCQFLGIDIVHFGLNRDRFTSATLKVGGNE